MNISHDTDVQEVPEDIVRALRDIQFEIEALADMFAALAAAAECGLPIECEAPEVLH